MKKNLLKTIALMLILLFGALAFTGCEKKEEAADVVKNANGPFPVTITDIYGSNITVDKEPQRIVALAPSIVEVLYKLDLGDKIVGVTDYCDYPAEAKDKTKVGSFNGVNIEKIVEQKPDIVLAGSGMSKEEYQKLLDMNIKVVVAESRTLSEVADTFTMIGKVTGAEDKAKILVDEFNGRINEIKDKVKGANKVKAYYVISFGKEGDWTGGSGTFISDLISLAGGENIAEDAEGWNQYSIEKIVEKNPDIIILSDMVANGTKDILDNEKGYRETNAVKNDKVVILDSNLIQRPGPRVVEGLEIIAKALHPELFDK